MCMMVHVCVYELYVLVYDLQMYMRCACVVVCFLKCLVRCAFVVCMIVKVFVYDFHVFVYEFRVLV